MKDLNREIQSVHKIIQLFEHAHARSEGALDGLPALFCVVDREGSVYRGNRFLGRLFNADHETLLNKSLSSLFTPESWAEFQKNLDAAQDGKQVIPQFEMQLSRSGGERVFLWNLLPLRHEYENTVKLTTIIALDVTELKLTTQLKSRMEGELKTAKAVQETLLPAEEATFQNCKISGRYHSASECGGDIWFYRQVEDKLVVCIADVMGHGAASALLSSGTRAVLGVDSVLSANPAKIMNQLNTTLLDLAKQLSFMTGMVGILDLNTGKFDYTYAAHEPFLHITSDPKTHSPTLTYCSSGPSSPLGAQTTPDFKIETLQLQPKDRIFLYTDGFFEMIDTFHNKIGPRRITNMLKGSLSGEEDVAKITAKLDQQVHECMARQPLLDDVTFLLLQYK